VNRDPRQGADSTRPGDPGDRTTDKRSEREKREKGLDKTIADSFPTSDPPSSIPDPGEDDEVKEVA